MSSRPRGRLFIVSAPSGTGKTTLCERLVQVVPGIRLSRSYTSRAARAGERDGVDYHFVTRPLFEAMIAEKSFLEWADVFGNLYGTSAADTEALLAAGEDVMLVIDVQGARQVRTRGMETVGIFVFPVSLPVFSCTSTPGGGCGGSTPRNVAWNHLPRVTGEVRAGFDVTASRPPLPINPRRTSSEAGNVTRRNCGP